MIELFERLKKSAASAADWRRCIAVRFPDDIRNQLAADKLRSLSYAEYEGVQEATWEAIRPHADQTYFPTVLNAANRAVGFTITPAGFNAYVAAIAQMAEGFAYTGGGQ